VKIKIDLAYYYSAYCCGCVCDIRGCK